jgi:hypothetical protein
LTKFKQHLNKDIKRTEIKEERESWEESAGGEAFIGDEKDEFQAFYRVQCFDPFLFTNRFQFDQLRVRINQPTEFRKATKEDFSEDSIPIHPNVIKNIANVELFYTHDEDYEDCLGWITLMEKGEHNLHFLLRNEIPTIAQRRLLAIELRKGLQYLFDIGLEHNDQKLENIVHFGETPKWIDFGVMHDHTGYESYRRMGYVRRGSKFRHFQALGKYSQIKLEITYDLKHQGRLDSVARVKLLAASGRRREMIRLSVLESGYFSSSSAIGKQLGPFSSNQYRTKKRQI